MRVCMRRNSAGVTGSSGKITSKVIKSLAPAGRPGVLSVINPGWIVVYKADTLPVEAFHHHGEAYAVQQRGIVGPSPGPSVVGSALVQAILVHKPVNRHVFAAAGVQNMPEACTWTIFSRCRASSAAKYLICSSLSRQISVTEASCLRASTERGRLSPVHSATTCSSTSSKVVNFRCISGVPGQYTAGYRHASF